MTHHLIEMPVGVTWLNLICGVKQRVYISGKMVFWNIFLKKSFSTASFVSDKIGSTSLCGNNKQCMISWFDEASAQIQKKEEESRIKDG